MLDRDEQQLMLTSSQVPLNMSASDFAHFSLSVQRGEVMA